MRARTCAAPPFATSVAYKRYALATMTAVYTLNLVDRSLMMLLLQPIKEDLHLSDTQLGFLTGIAFALFYAVLGLPIARWADRGDRVTIASCAIGLWGVVVMATVWVNSYAQLAIARMAAAVGEAGCKPPTYSLIGDYFLDPAERTRAMAVYLSGGLFATLLSFVAGGWLNEAYGWRMTFFLMGIPGLLLAALVRLTIREPRATADTAHALRKSGPSMRVVFAILWRQRSSRHLGIALILLYMMGLGLGPWYAAFLMRTHGMGTQELGLQLGLIFCLGGVVGTLSGGYIATRWFAENECGQMRLSAATVAMIVPSFVLFLVAPGRGLALAAMVPLVVVSGFFLGPTYALMQRLVDDEMRATMLAVVMLFANLIGMGLGPQIVGILSDTLMPVFGADSLRYAMLALSFISLWASYHFWQAGQTVRTDLAARHGPRHAGST